MKRALSLVLAIVMVLSLSVTAMAAWVDPPRADLDLPTAIAATSGAQAVSTAPIVWNVTVGNFVAAGPGYDNTASSSTRNVTATVTFTPTRRAPASENPAQLGALADVTAFAGGTWASQVDLPAIPGATGGAWDDDLPAPVTATLRLTLTAVWNEGGSGGGTTTPPGGGGNNNAAVRQVPNGWRVDGVVDGASFVDQMNALWNRDRVRGDDEVRIGLTPADFEWRVPRNARRDASNNLIDTRASGWDSVSWTVAVNEYTDSANRAGLLAIGNRSDALQTVHFDRVQLRTTRTVGMNGTIRDVTFHRDTGA